MIEEITNKSAPTTLDVVVSQFVDLVANKVVERVLPSVHDIRNELIMRLENIAENNIKQVVDRFLEDQIDHKIKTAFESGQFEDAVRDAIDNLTFEVPVR